MNLIPEELKIQTFPCPNCQQFISSEVDVCKFCSMPISSDIKSFAIGKELNKKRNINLNRQKNTFITGIASLVIGIFLIVSPIIQLQYSNGFNLSCLMPIFIIGGIIAIVKGLIGYREEKRKV
jgi:hypothetical protein